MRATTYNFHSSVPRLFDAADKDHSGTLDKEEVRAALTALVKQQTLRLLKNFDLTNRSAKGFSWLDDESKVGELISRADLDTDHVINL